MIFSSPYFIFLFLPIVWLVYQGLARWQQPSLLVAWLALVSLIFYGVWDYGLLPILLLSISVNYLVGRQLQKQQSRLWLFIGILFNLGLLGYFKYRFFAVSLYQWNFSALESLALPLGISFFTFQQIAFLTDVRRGVSRCERFPEYLLFVAFFPQLIAGPIVHHKQIAPQFTNLQAVSGSHIHQGLLLFSIGLAKKLLIADQLAPFVDQLYAVDRQGLVAGDTLAAGWAYGMQLYFDFSGYADMAIGLGLLFGVTLPRNFDSPYKAASVQAFWRSWHMTLSRFLRDYLYVPLGGNRHGLAIQVFALMVTMLLGGLWHGAGWQFLLWGGLHGLALVICLLWRKWIPVRLPRLLGWALTFVFVMLAWVSFRSDSLQQTWLFYSALTEPGLGSLAALFLGRWPDVTTVAHPMTILLGATLIAITTPNSQTWVALFHRRQAVFAKGVVVGIVLIICGKTMLDAPTQAFLYFNF